MFSGRSYPENWSKWSKEKTKRERSRGKYLFCCLISRAEACTPSTLPFHSLKSCQFQDLSQQLSEPYLIITGLCKCSMFVIYRVWTNYINSFVVLCWGKEWRIIWNRQQQSSGWWYRFSWRRGWGRKYQSFVPSTSLSSHASMCCRSGWSMGFKLEG